MSYHKPIGGFARLIDPRHRAASRAVGFALTLLDEQAMWEASAVLHARLHPGERKFHAAAALLALQDLEYRDVCDFVESGSRAPITPLFDPLDEAAFWAGIAYPDELRTYAVACFERMSPSDRSDFAAYVSESRAA